MNDAPQSFDPAIYARLARLELSPEEHARYAREFQTLLEYFGAIARVDAAGVEPMVYPLEQHLRMRPDEARDSGAREAILGNGPSVANGEFFRVPKVIES